MSKIYKRFAALLSMLVLAALLWPARSAAQSTPDYTWQWQDDFSDYMTGQLTGQGDWWQYSSSALHPIQLQGEALEYEGYPGGVSGKTVYLDGGDESWGSVNYTAQKAYVLFNTEVDAENKVYGIHEGSVYLSFLLKVDRLGKDNVYPVCLVKKGYYDFADGKTGGEIGFMAIKSVEGSETQYRIGINPANASSYAAKSEFSEPLELGQTYLVAIRYEINAELNGKDNMYLWVNPTDFATEPTASVKYDAEAKSFTGGLKNSSSYGIQGLMGLEIRQSGGYNSQGVNMHLGMLRMSDSWSGLFIRLPENTTPRILAAPKALFLGDVLQGKSATGEITVRGKYLTGDVTAAVAGSDLTLEQTTLANADVMADAGIQLRVNLTANTALSETDPATVTDTIRLNSEGAAEMAIPVAWNVYPIKAMVTAGAFNAEEITSSSLYYQIDSDVVVTRVDYVYGYYEATIYYVQDATGGFILYDENNALDALNLKAGDKLSGVIGTAAPGSFYAYAGNLIFPEAGMLPTVVSEGNTVAPVTITAEELTGNLGAFANRVVKISGLTTTAENTHDTFASGELVKVSDGTAAFSINPFAGTTLQDVAVPTQEFSVTGISTSASSALVRPRSAEDVTIDPAPWQWQDDFRDYQAGSQLTGQGDWMQYGYASTAPIQVAAEPLAYEGYPDKGVTGKSVTFESVAMDEYGEESGALQQAYAVINRDADVENGLYGITSGDIYYSALVNINSIGHDNQYFMTLLKRGSIASSWDEGSSGTEIGRLYSKASGEGYQLGINGKSTTSQTAYADRVLEFGKTYLVVVKYSVDPNLKGADNMKLFIDPVNFQNEPEADATFDAAALGFTSGITYTSWSNSTLGIEGLEIRHSGTATYSGNDFKLGMVRASNKWKALFTEKPEDTTPRIIVTPKKVSAEGLLQGDTFEQTFTVKGKYLTGDVTVSAEDDLSLDKTTLALADVMSETGATVTMTLKADKLIENYDTTAYVTFAAEAADTVPVPVTWSVTEVKTFATAAEFNAFNDEEYYGMVRYTGKALITYAGTAQSWWGGSYSRYYLQDETGAFTVPDSYGLLEGLYHVGDSITNLSGSYYPGSYDGLAGNILEPYGTAQAGEILSSGNAIRPVDVTMEDFAANFANYANMLIAVGGVQFKDVPEDKLYTETAYLTFTDGTNEALMNPFDASLFAGKAVIDTTVCITGISTSAENPVLRPRVYEDVESDVVDYGTFQWADDFNYPDGDLYGQGNWMLYNHDSSFAPIQVVNKPLEYPNYPGGVYGKSIELQGNYQDEGSTTPLQKNFNAFAPEGITAGTIYYSALIKVTEPSEGSDHSFMKLLARNTELEDSLTATELAGLYTKPGSSSNTYYLGVSRVKPGYDFSSYTSIKASYMDQELEVGKTYLVVVKYEINAEGDKVSLMLDPTNFKKEPEAVVVNTSNVTLAEGSAVRGIEIAQTETSTYAGVSMFIGSMRISDTYAGLFKEVERIPSFSISDTKFDRAEGLVGQQRNVGMFHISARNLPGEVTLEITGADADQFVLTKQTISAGNSDQDIYVNYVPTAIGQHKAYVSIDCPEMTEISQIFQISGIAIDPENLPLVTIEPEVVPEMTAEEGKTAEVTVKVHSENLPDHVALKITSGGAFRISHSLMTKNIDQDLTITFVPTALGEFNDTIVVSTYGMEDLLIPVKGVCVLPDAIEALEQENGDIEVYDMAGRQVFRAENTTLKAARVKLPAGVYVVKQNNRIRKIQVK